MFKKKPRSIIRKAAAVFSLCIIAAVLIWFHFFEQGNFHAVVKGGVYRSGQLRAEKLSQYINKYGIKSVLNLRGANEGTDWWEKEAALCSRLGVRYYNIALSSKQKPSQEQIKELLSILKDAPKPLLIHCAHGADRSGLVSAIYLNHFEGKSCRDARKQISILHGHIPIYRPKIGEAFDEFCNN